MEDNRLIYQALGFTLCDEDGFGGLDFEYIVPGKEPWVAEKIS